MRADDAIAKLSEKIYREFFLRQAITDTQRQQIYVSSCRDKLDALRYSRSFRDGMEEQDFWKTKLEYAESVNEHTSRNQAWVKDGCRILEWLKDAYQEWLKNRNESYNPYDYDYDLDSCPARENSGCRDTQEIVSVAHVDDNIGDDALDLFLAQFKITAEKE